MNNKTEVRVPSTRSLSILCTVGALAFGVLTILAFRNSPISVFAAGMPILVLTAMAGALFFASLSRASAQARSAVQEEKVLAEGIGRMSGRLTGLVVVATDKRIVAVSARVIHKPKILASIPYQRIIDFQANSDSLDVWSKDDRISLAKCAPNQVASLADELRLHVAKQL